MAATGQHSGGDASTLNVARGREVGLPTLRPVSEAIFDVDVYPPWMNRTLPPRRALLLETNRNTLSS
jgi:hypothetical protein